MKVLNLYAGIGGNRKLWQDVDVTAIELNPQIAKIYQDFFPKDKVIVADAHQYLLEHFKEFEFIWSSRPCITHSKCNNFLHSQGIIRYPDFGLYEEIVFLDKWFTGKWCVENVMPYYQPLIKPRITIDRHCFWTNFIIEPMKIKRDFNAVNAGGKKGEKRETTHYKEMKNLQNYHRIIIEHYKVKGFGTRQKTFALRNCVLPELGLHILNESQKNIQPELFNKEM